MFVIFMLLYKCTYIYHRVKVIVLIIKDSHKFTSDGYRLSSSAKDHIFFLSLYWLS